MKAGTTKKKRSHSLTALTALGPTIFVPKFVDDGPLIQIVEVEVTARDLFRTQGWLVSSLGPLNHIQAEELSRQLLEIAERARKLKSSKEKKAAKKR